MEVEILVAELGITPADDQLFRILYDGTDLRDFRLAALRDKMALVSQDTFLFSDTLRNNIRFARPDATDAEIEAAAKAAAYRRDDRNPGSRADRRRA